MTKNRHLKKRENREKGNENFFVHLTQKTTKN
jgi:hypothetical protein